MERLPSLLWSGIDPSNMADGGPECLAQVSVHARAAISVPFLCVAVFLLRTVLPICNKSSATCPAGLSSGALRALGWFQVFVYLVQSWYKSRTGTLIYMLMPCHLVGFGQTYCCFTHNLTWFRILNHYGLYGAVLAVVMPELSTLHQLFEAEFYFVEHIQLLMVPMALCFLRIYTTEPLADMKYAVCGWALNLCVALGLHQLLSVLIQGNFNLMGCANGALPEPVFRGTNMYQWVGVALCTVLCFTFGKVYSCLLLKPIEVWVRESESVKAA